MNEQELLNQISNLKERNKKVEAEKAWETSSARKISIAVLTYLVAVVVMYFLKVEKYYLNAFIPVIGYLLSTISLPFIKSQWMKNYFRKDHDSR